MCRRLPQLAARADTIGPMRRSISSQVVGGRPFRHLLHVSSASIGPANEPSRTAGGH